MAKKLVNKIRLFENDVTITGKHATHLKYLVDETNLFEKYIDVYMCAAVYGYLNGCKDEKDNTSNDRARIYADTLSNYRQECILIYRLITLLDDKDLQLDVEERVNRAFRYDAQPDNIEGLEDNIEIFNSYIRGGIERLYIDFTDGATSKDDYIRQSFFVLKEFKDELNGVSYEEKIKKLLSK